MNWRSASVVVLAITVMVFVRVQYVKWDTKTLTNTLTWDALGYYIDLPGQFIYNDIGPYNWFPKVKEDYNLPGPVYQLSPLPNGNKAMKYLIGISILYAPFFFMGHAAAIGLGYPADGFSAPYQLAICLAALFYALLGLWVLRWVLLRFFSDTVSAIVLLLIALATNYPQYVSVDSGQTHCFLFTMYALVLYATIRWHEQPGRLFAFLIGLILGLTTIARPTEVVMLFIPLLWNTQNKESRRKKWKTLFQNRGEYAILTALGGLIGVLPQLAYWKVVTGKWVYDVGSKFTFFRPHWQVLIGWEKGWFIYTPIAIFMVIGLFLMKGRPFKRSVLTYFIINTWIIIAWADWRYGGSYSCRALAQSYPVMALPLALLVERLLATRMKWLTLGVGAYLIAVNLFQLWQYNKTIIHYNDNNGPYYRAVYLNAHPTPLDMSLMDTPEILRDESSYRLKNTVQFDTMQKINAPTQAKVVFWEQDLATLPGYASDTDGWLRITARVKSDFGAYESSLTTQLTTGGKVKQTDCRLQNGICKDGEWNTIEYYFRIPATSSGKVVLYAETKASQDIYLKDVAIRLFQQH